MQPLLDSPPPVHPYAQGSWGPAEAEKLVAAYGGWHGPWVEAQGLPSRGAPGPERAQERE